MVAASVSDRRRRLVTRSSALVLACVFVLPASAQLDLRSGDRVAFVGNTFAERLRLGGFLESALLAAYPDLELSFRNLGWSADEVSLQPRPLNFGPLEAHLLRLEIDVALLFFGANEAFAGEEGLADFERDLERLLARLRQRPTAGGETLRLALVSPIPQEQTRFGPPVAERNRLLSLYSRAVAGVAGAHELPFVDLFAPMEAAMRASPQPLTINGLHLNARGDRAAAAALLAALTARPPGSVGVVTVRSNDVEGGECRLDRLPVGLGEQVRVQVQSVVPGRWSLELGGRSVATAEAGDWLAGVELPARDLAGAWGAAEQLRNTVVAKNRLFFDWQRAVNGYYIYGDRREPFGVVSFPPEMLRFAELVEQHDGRIHELARPGSVACRLVRAQGAG
jgi:hypothetical protein